MSEHEATFEKASTLTESSPLIAISTAVPINHISLSNNPPPSSTSSSSYHPVPVSQPEADADVCSLCGVSFYKWNSMRRLLHGNACRSRKPIPVVASTSSAHECSHCNRSFNSKKGLSLHQKKCSASNTPASSGRQSLESSASDTSDFFIKPQKPLRSRPTTNSKLTGDEELQTAIALSRSLVEETKRRETQRKLDSKELPVPVALTLSKQQVADILANRVACVLADTAFPCPRRCALPVNVELDPILPTELHALPPLSRLWQEASTSLGDLRSYYVALLVPPLSPCKVPIQERLLGMSQVPGREKSRWSIANSQLLLELETGEEPDEPPAVMSQGFFIQCSNEAEVKSEKSPQILVDPPQSPVPLWREVCTKEEVSSVTPHQVRLLTMLNSAAGSDLMLECAQQEFVYAHKFILIAYGTTVDLERQTCLELTTLSRCAVLRVLVELYSGLQFHTHTSEEEAVYCRLGISAPPPSETDLQPSVPEPHLGTLPSPVSEVPCKVPSPVPDVGYEDPPPFEDTEVPPSDMPFQVPVPSFNAPSEDIEMPCEDFAPLPEMLSEVPSSLPEVPCEVSSRLPEVSCEVPSRLPEVPCEVSSRLPEVSCEVPSRLHEVSCEVPSRLPEVSCEVPSRLPEVSCEVPSRLHEVSCEVPTPLAIERMDGLPDQVDKIAIFVEETRLDTSVTSSVLLFSQPMVTTEDEAIPQTEMAVSDDDLFEGLPTNVSIVADKSQVQTDDELFTPAPLAKRLKLSLPQDSPSMSQPVVPAAPIPRLRFSLSQPPPVGNCATPEYPHSPHWTPSVMTEVSTPVLPQRCLSPPPTTTTPLPVTTHKPPLLYRSPLTPMPLYDQMVTPQLKKSLAEFGVRPLGKKKAVILLKEIYRFTHQDKLAANIEAPTAPKSVPLPTEDTNDEDSEDSEDAENKMDFYACAGALEESLLVFDEEEEEDDESGPTKKSAPTGTVQNSNEPAEKQVLKFILSQPNLYQNVLLYEPLELDALHAEVKGAGIKLGLQRLMNVLDEQCITFTMRGRNATAPKGQSQRHQRGRPRTKTNVSSQGRVARA